MYMHKSLHIDITRRVIWYSHKLCTCTDMKGDGGLLDVTWEGSWENWNGMTRKSGLRMLNSRRCSCSIEFIKFLKFQRKQNRSFQFIQFSSFIHPLCIDMFDGRKKFSSWNWDNLFLLHFKGITWCMQIEKLKLTNIFRLVLLKLLANIQLYIRLAVNISDHFSFAVIFSFIIHLFSSSLGLVPVLWLSKYSSSDSLQK